MPRLPAHSDRSATPRAIARAGGLWIVLAILTAWPASAQQLTQSEQTRLTSWYRSALKSAPGTWGIAIGDEQGHLLWGVKSDSALIPASAVKVLTTGFARSAVGDSARRPTRVVAHGHLDSFTGTWVGSWALELNGDPSLGRGRSGPTLDQLAHQLRTQGIRRVSGPFKVVSRDGPAEATYPSSWSSRHRGHLFAPLIGMLTINENSVAFKVRPGKQTGDKATISWERPVGVGRLIRVTATTVGGRKTRLKVRTAPGGGWVVSGTIGVGARSKYLAVPATNPEAVLAAAWASALRRAGIKWDARGRVSGDTTRIVLAEVVSPTFDSLALDINKRSNNLGAELLLRWGSDSNNPAQQLTDHVRQVSGHDGVTLADGSGLSYEDRVSPAVFTSYLARFPWTSGGQNFPQLLPAAGSGTLKGLQRGLPARGVVRAKTGTLRRVSTIVGYLGRPDGVLTISLMYNGPRPSAARRAQWQLFRQLGANGVIVPEDFGERDPIQLGAESTPVDPMLEIAQMERALSVRMLAPDREIGR